MVTEPISSFLVTLLFQSSMHSCTSSWKMYCSGSTMSKNTISLSNFGFASCFLFVSVVFQGSRSATPRRNLRKGSLRGKRSWSSLRRMSMPSMHLMDSRPRVRILPREESSKNLSMFSPGAAGTKSLCCRVSDGAAAGAASTSFGLASRTLLRFSSLPGTSAVCAVDTLWFSSALGPFSSSASSSSARFSAGTSPLSTPKGSGCCTNLGASSSSSDDSNSGISFSLRLITFSSFGFFTRSRGGWVAGAVTFCRRRISSTSGSSFGGARPPSWVSGGGLLGAGALVSSGGFKDGGRGCPSGMPTAPRGGAGLKGRGFMSGEPGPPGGPALGGPRGGGRAA